MKFAVPKVSMLKQVIIWWAIPIKTMKFRLITLGFTFYHLGTFRDKLMAHWLDFYEIHHRNQSKRNVKYRLSIDEIIVVIIALAFGFRGLALNVSDSLLANYRFKLSSGAIYHLIHATAFNVELLFFIWSSNYLAVIYMSRLCTAENFEWLKVCKVLEEDLPPQSIGKYIKL